MIISFLRFLLFVSSTYGYMTYCKEKIKIDDECLPVFVFSGIGSIIFLSGILNIMSLAFWGIFLLGLFLNVYYVIKKREIFPRSLGIQVFTIFILLLFVFLIDEKYYHYDNFTHWGLVIKNIYRDAAFPNFQDTLITFQSYPLGSASFIWYVCKVIGYSEGLTMFAHSALILSCALTLFMFTKQIKGITKWVADIVAGIFCIVGICYGGALANGPFNLLVDKLLAFIAIAAFIIVYKYRFELNKGIISVIPLLTFVIVVKNSGIVWVIAIIIEIGFFWLKSSKREWKQMGLTGVAFALPMLFRYLWDQHVDLVFATGNVSSHAMSAENYSATLAKKTPENIELIKSLFMERVFSFENKIWVLAVSLIIMFIVVFFLDRKIIKKINGMFIAFYLVLIYIIYQVGNYVMYLVSMPIDEALQLGGYSRYVATVELFAWGIIIMTLFVILGQIEPNINCKISILIMVVFGFGILGAMTDDISLIYKHELPISGRETSRTHLDEIIAKYQLEPNKKCLVYIGDPQDRDVNYRWWMSRYLLYSSNVTTVYSKDVSILKNLANYDYLVVLERDETIDNYLKEQKFSLDEECIIVDNYQYVKAADYISSLNDSNYIVFMSVADDASAAFTSEMKDAMFELGLSNDLTGQYRKSYAAVVDSNQVVYEQLSEEKVEYSGKSEGLEYSVASAGFAAGSQSKIIINGVDYSLNSRGINIVVYDKEAQAVVDQVTFDTWLQDGAWMLK